MASLGHPCKFQSVSRVGFITAATLLTGGQANFARCLDVSSAGALCIHFGGLLSPNGILPRAKFIVYASTQHLQLCLVISSQLRHVWTIGKNLLNNNMSSRCAHNVMNVGQLTAEMFWRVWGTPANLNRFGILVFRYCTNVNQRRSTKL